MPRTQRQRLLNRLHHYFARERMPRLAMLLVLALTAGAGFLSSRGLLAVGVLSMPVRYALATLAGWFAFIVIVRIWVKIEQSSIEADRAISNNQTATTSDGSNPALEAAADAAIQSLDLSSDGEEFGCLAGIAVSALVFVFIVTIGSVFALISSAPALIAEAFLDVLVAGVFANKLKLHDAQWWAFGVIRRTWAAALCIAVILSTAGFAMQEWKPGIQTIGEFFAK